jgi:hypothetical protein
LLFIGVHGWVAPCVAQPTREHQEELEICTRNS